MVKFNFNFRFYKQSQFWFDFIVVLLIVPLVLISVSLLNVAPLEKERFPAPATSDQVVISGVPENIVAVPLVIVNESMLQLPLTVRQPPFLFSIIFV